MGCIELLFLTLFSDSLATNLHNVAIEIQFTLVKATEVPTCVGKEEGTYRNRDDCTAFYRCMNGTPFLFNCADDLAYSEELGSCVPKHLVPECRDDER